MNEMEEPTAWACDSGIEKEIKIRNPKGLGSWTGRTFVRGCL